MSHEALGGQFKSQSDRDLDDKLAKIVSAHKAKGARRRPSNRDFSTPQPEKRYDDRGLPVMFHGTGHDISYNVVMPSDALSHRSKWKEFYDSPPENWRKSRVFAAESENSAWTWAQGPGRPRVHEVYLKDPKIGTGEWHGEFGMVKNTQWIPPPHSVPGSHVQGTLPPQDWGKEKNWKRYTGMERPPEPEQRNLHPQQFAGQGKLFE